MKTQHRLRRLAATSALVGLAVLSGPGCQTFIARNGTKVASNDATSNGEPNAPKTEFHRDVTPEQEYNVHVELARVYESQGNNEAAIAEYQKASDSAAQKGSVLVGAQLGPAQHALAERRMAAAFDRMGRFAQADVHYQKALKAAPNDPKTWNDAGYSYYLQNRLADAERSLKTAESLDPNNPRSLTNLGLVLAAQGKDDAALTALSRAGGPAVGHANLGYILAALGKTEAARQHYQTAVGLQPNLVAAKVALAKLDTPQAPAPGGPAMVATPIAAPRNLAVAVPAPAPAPASHPAPSPPPVVNASASAPGLKDPSVARSSVTATTNIPLPKPLHLRVVPKPPTPGIVAQPVNRNLPDQRP